jgi:ribonuclease HII
MYSIDPSLFGIAESKRSDGPDADDEGVFFIAGVDEAGRGALAGPVVAGAVILPENPRINNLADSKALTPLQREEIYSIIFERAASVGLGIVSARVVDEINVLNATLLAMVRAVRRMEVIPQYVLVDGDKKIPVSIPQTAVVRGDIDVPVISAASVVAKVYRDAIMDRLDDEFPGYGFKNNKGYATLDHKKALERMGPARCHRFTYRPVREVSRRFAL